MKIRNYTEGDLESILSVALLAFSPIHESFRKILGEDIFRLVYPDWKTSQSDYIRSLAEGEESERIHVVEIDTRTVIGFVHFSMNRDNNSGKIGINCVHPDCQGKGIGKMMYEFVIHIMKEEEIKFVEVGTGGDDSHLPARKAYESCGFTQLPLAKYYLNLEETERENG